MSARAVVDICICTYDRASLTDCLRSVVAQQLDEPFRVIVADNGEQPSAEARIAPLGQTAVPITLVHAPARNISIARNACLEAATGEWVAFIDDDEIAEPGWLAGLLAEAQRGGWDAVLGPVAPNYGEQAPRWMSAGGFHATQPVFVRGEILTGYTSNALVRREKIEALGLRFLLEYGRTGGEDLDFFYRLHDGGGRIGYAPGAVVSEGVPPDRARLGWLMRRSFRAGQSHGSRLLSRPGGGSVPVMAMTAAAKAGICGLGAVLTAPAAVRRNRFLVRGALHAGAVARLLGWRELESY